MCEPARTKFCWACSNKLQGGIHTHKVIDGEDRVLHKECARWPWMAAMKLHCKPDGEPYEDDCPKCGCPPVSIGPGSCKCWQADPFNEL